MGSKTLNILHENEFGHIAICNCCGQYHISMGNVILTLDDTEFKEFIDYMYDMNSYARIEKAQYNRKFMLRFNEENVVLAFSRKEIKETLELINVSRIMIEAKSLIK